MNSSQLPVPIGSPGAAVATGSSMLVEIGGRALRAELHRLPGLLPRYSLAVANQTPLYLLVSFRVRRLGGDRPIRPGELWIDPHAQADLQLNVPPWRALLGGMLIVRLVNGRLRHELAAPLPAGAWLGGGVCGALTAAAAAGVLLLARPHVDLFAVPPVAVAGEVVQVPYAVGGEGSARFRVENERGATVASGVLPTRTGTLAFRLPTTTAAGSYTVSLNDTGPLGVADRSEPLAALPAAPPAVRPLIESISLDRAQVADGSPVTVRYRTTATHGNVAIVDARNTIWAQAPLARSGITRLTLPRFGGNRELLVRLDARRGAQHATAAVGLEVVASPQPGPGMPGAAPVDIAQDRVQAGQAVRAAIAPGATDVRLALETPAGKPVASLDVPDGASDAEITVPRGARGTLVLVATYDVGDGEESVVRRITIDPPG